MHESMMIAEVGGIENVSGSRIAMPFAPPRPGSTPMITPRLTPMNISMRLKGVSATAKPWNSAAISPNCFSPDCRSVTEERERIERALVQRHLEPDFERRESRRADRETQHDAFQPAVLAEPVHEYGDVDGRSDVQADQLNPQHVQH